MSESTAFSFAATVSRQLVHRNAICEVFLTDTVRHDDEDFSVAAQLPRVHSYFSDHASSPSGYDPLLLMECCRQASMYLAHEYFAVPRGHKFILNESDIWISDPDAVVIGAHPGRAVLRARLTERKHRDGVLVGFSLHIVISLDGQEAGVLDIAIQWMPPEAWDKLRERSRAALDLTDLPTPQHIHRLTPGAVARLSDRNVVLGDVALSGTEVAATVIVDQENPGFFDHPLDHVPGMLLFEAVRQTAIVAAHELFGLSPNRLSMVACGGRFTRFAEFELPTVCRARLGEVSSASNGLASAEVTVWQGGAAIATGTAQLKTTCALEPIWLPGTTGSGSAELAASARR